MPPASRRSRVLDLLAWLRSLTPPDIGAGETRAITTMILAACVALAILSLTLPAWAHLLSLPQVFADFPGFYLGGQILDELGPSNLYDLKVQEGYFLRLRPSAGHLGLPFLYPPFVAVAFGPLARLSYEEAALLWSAISSVLFASGTYLLFGRFRTSNQGTRIDSWLVTVSFGPFLMETLLGGQISTVAFFVISLSLSLDLAGRPFLSGLILSACLYKPPLAMLLVCMLVVARQWRQLGGVVAGAVSIGLATSLILRAGVWGHYFSLVGAMGKLYMSSPSVLRVHKYLDIRTAVSALTGVWWLGPLILVMTAMFCLPGLVRLWWRSGSSAEFKLLAWAASLTWTLVLNAYVPIYDATLLIIAVVILSDLTLRPALTAYRSSFLWLILIVFCASWASGAIAQLFRVQVMTIALLGVGGYCLVLAKAQSKAMIGR